MAYKIYTKQNLADTSRDPDDIVIEELGYKNNLDDALSLGNKFIKDNFFHKDTTIKRRSDGTYTATDFCSYGKTLIIKEIIID